MEYRVLGKTKLRVSSVGIGGIPIQRADASAAKQLLARATEMGVNFIDTARAYTVSEEFLGQALSGIRDQFVLATKSGAKTKQDMMRDIDISLRLLQTDYIDLYQIHNPSPAGLAEIIAPGGALEALKEAKAAGKIGHIGITLHLESLFEKALDMDWVETIMFPYNIVEVQAKALIARCHEKNIGFICMKPLAGGALENANLAMRFLAQDSNISVVIPGMADVAELEHNVAAFSTFLPLSIDEQAEIDQIRRELGTQFCRRCNYCAPCTAGIPISSVFLIEGYLTRYHLTQWAQMRYAALEKTASDCIGCGVCETRCPYQLPIREMMARAAAEFGR